MWTSISVQPSDTSANHIFENVVLFATMLGTCLSIQFVANKPLIAKCPDTVIVFMGRLWICFYYYFCEYIIFQFFMFIPHSTKGKTIPGNGVLASVLNCVEWTRFTHFFFLFFKQANKKFFYSLPSAVPAAEQLEHQYSQRPAVGWTVVAFVQNDLRRHVLWGPAERPGLLT